MTPSQVQPRRYPQCLSKRRRNGGKRGENGKKQGKGQCFVLVTASKWAESERTISPDHIVAPNDTIVGLTIDESVSKEEFSRALKPRVESRDQVGAHEHYKNTRRSIGKP